jgi:hypothetical protein
MRAGDVSIGEGGDWGRGETRGEAGGKARGKVEITWPAVTSIGGCDLVRGAFVFSVFRKQSSNPGFVFHW